jgi:hypothetical protein
LIQELAPHGGLVTVLHQANAAFDSPTRCLQERVDPEAIVGDEAQPGIPYGTDHALAATERVEVIGW